MRRKTEYGQIEVLGDSLVKLHKVLKKEDMLLAKDKAGEFGEEANLTPTIIIDFASITSIQEDYRRNGTVIIDKKTAVVVVEPLNDVLDAWLEVKENLSKHR